LVQKTGLIAWRWGPVARRAQPPNGPPRPGHRRECVGSAAGGEHASPDGCRPEQL
jgi:hypothetical protein